MSLVLVLKGGNPAIWKLFFKLLSGLGLRVLLAALATAQHGSKGSAIVSKSHLNLLHILELATHRAAVPAIPGVRRWAFFSNVAWRSTLNQTMEPLSYR